MDAFGPLDSLYDILHTCDTCASGDHPQFGTPPKTVRATAYDQIDTMIRQLDGMQLPPRPRDLPEEPDPVTPPKKCRKTEPKQGDRGGLCFVICVNSSQFNVSCNHLVVAGSEAFS